MFFLNFCHHIFIKKIDMKYGSFRKPKIGKIRRKISDFPCLKNK
jgi:hypothetical protein